MCLEAFIFILKFERFYRQIAGVCKMAGMHRQNFNLKKRFKNGTFPDNLQRIVLIFLRYFLRLVEFTELIFLFIENHSRNPVIELTVQVTSLPTKIQFFSLDNLKNDKCILHVFL